jgi:hypothetical protein
MTFSRRQLHQELGTAFDRRRNLPPNLTYRVLIGRVQCPRSQIPSLGIALPCIMQVAHYPDRPGSQSPIIGQTPVRDNGIAYSIENLRRAGPQEIPARTE